MFGHCRIFGCASVRLLSDVLGSKALADRWLLLVRMPTTPSADISTPLPLAPYWYSKQAFTHCPPLEPMPPRWRQS